MTVFHTFITIVSMAVRDDKYAPKHTGFHRMETWKGMG